MALFFVADVRDVALPSGRGRRLGLAVCFQYLLGRSACTVIFFEAEEFALDPVAGAVPGGDAGLETVDGTAVGIDGELLSFDGELGWVVRVGGGGGEGVDEFAHVDDVAVLEELSVPESGDELVGEPFGLGGFGSRVG